VVHNNELGVATLDNTMEPFGSEKSLKLAYMVIVIRV
jgi:hypothetical protein